MVSKFTHTEPSGRPHTKEELMHPGRTHQQDVACPDPSAHEKPNKQMQEQASSAALYPSSPNIDKQDILDKDNNLSSKGAAMSLKYAAEQDLPSFPVVGIATDSSLSAAQLANKNTKGPNIWKPDASASASKAAMIAKDYKPAAIWKPDMSAAGSKAAILAQKDAGKLDWWQPSASPDGSSAASQAMRNAMPSADVDYGYTKDGRSKALTAATDAVKLNRARAESTPPVPAETYPDARNSAANALNAATAANKPRKQSVKNSDRLESDAMEAARIRHIDANVSREMWTEHPPVDIEVAEKNHNAALHASAISMAKQIYSAQQTVQNSRSSAQSAALASSQAQQAASTTPDLKTQAKQYINLQKAAYERAQERLAKLDPDGTARFREHYGYETQAPKSRLSIRSKPRPASESNAAADSDSDDDTYTSRRIRNQMSQLKQKIQDTDAQKRQTDRAKLMAIAEKRVHAQLHSMDERVYANTGKVSPAMLEQWEDKARQKAAKDSADRTQNLGKTYIGQGRYLDSAEIEAIAAAKLKPTLDAINETAERRRLYDEQVKLEEEANKRRELREKKNDKYEKIEIKRAKHEQKMMAKQDKVHQKAAAKEEKLVMQQIKSQQKDAEKLRLQGVAKDKYLDKRERSRSGSRSRNKVYGIDAANASVNHGLGSSTSLNERSNAVATTEDVPPVPPIDRSVGGLSTVGADGKKVLRPEIERQVTTIETSESESEEHVRDGSNKKAIEPVTGLAIDLSKGTGQGGTDAQPQIQGFDAAATNSPQSATKDTKTASSTSPRSPVKQIGRLFHRLRRSRAPTAEDKTQPTVESTPSDVAPGTAITGTPVAVPAPKSESQAAEHVLTSPETSDSENASASSFRRHQARRMRSSSDDSSSDSDAEPVRGRSGPHSRDSLNAEEHSEVTGGLLPSTVALVSGAAEPSNRPQDKATELAHEPLSEVVRSASGNFDAGHAVEEGAVHDGVGKNVVDDKAGVVGGQSGNAELENTESGGALAAPEPISRVKTASPVPGSKFHEEV